MNEDPTSISMPALKAGASIAAATGAQIVDSASRTTSIFADLFVLNWPNIASAAAACYTLALLIEFCWKRFWRPFFERLNWIEPRRTYTAREWAERMAQQDSGRVPLE